MEERDLNPASPDQFSQDPQENLHIENEILKMKIQAETGASFGAAKELPPELENQFLQNVQRFEDAWRTAATRKIYDLIGRPAFRLAEEMDDSEIPAASQTLLGIMESHGIRLDVLCSYEPRVIYRFITEELFEYETEDMQLPGWTTNFIYEEFHPNHRMDIEDRAIDFLDRWFGRSFGKCSCTFAPSLILPNSRILAEAELMQKIDHVFQSYRSFSDCRFAIADISFELGDGENPSLGFAEGAVEYKAQTEGNEVIDIQGPFKLYMSNEGYGWSIFYFVFPGFEW